jgi:hypothetical protein
MGITLYSLANQSQNQTWISLCKQDEEYTMKLMRILMKDMGALTLGCILDHWAIAQQ